MSTFGSEEGHMALESFKVENGFYEAKFSCKGFLNKESFISEEPKEEFEKQITEMMLETFEKDCYNNKK